jgi:Ni/Co efflux regulator RcnB
MKSAILIAVAVVIVSSLPVVLRQTDAAAQENATAHPASTQADRSAFVNAQARPKSDDVSGSASSNTQRPKVNRESVVRFDSNSSKTGSAKAGDTAEAKARRKARPAAIVATK